MALVSYTTEELKKTKSETDWERVLAMKDEDIVIDADCPDTIELVESGRGTPLRRGGRPLHGTRPKVQVTLRVDADALAKLRASGKGWQSRLSEQISRWAAML